MIEIFFLVIGFSLFSYGIILIRKDKLARGWIKTSGVITSSDFKTKANSDNEGYSYNTYLAKCQYEYTPINSNKSIIGTNVLPYYNHGWTTNREEQLNIYRKLSKGTKIKVYYHPKNKSKSCLVVGKNYSTKLISFIGLSIFLIGFGIYVQNLSENNTQERLLESIEVLK